MYRARHPFEHGGLLAHRCHAAAFALARTRSTRGARRRSLDARKRCGCAAGAQTWTWRLQHLPHAIFRSVGRIKQDRPAGRFLWRSRWFAYRAAFGIMRTARPTRATLHRRLDMPHHCTLLPTTLHWTGSYRARSSALPLRRHSQLPAAVAPLACTCWDAASHAAAPRLPPDAARASPHLLYTNLGSANCLFPPPGVQNDAR